MYAESACQEIRPVVLNRVAKWNDFCVKQSQGLKVSAAHIKTFTQVSLWVPFEAGVYRYIEQIRSIQK